MTTRTDITKTGGHADGTFDRIETASFYLRDAESGGWLDCSSVVVEGDESLNLFTQYHPGNPWLAQTYSGATAALIMENTKSFNAAGQITYDNISRDIDGDGLLMDTETGTAYAYNAAGRMTSMTIQNWAWGELIPNETIVESYYYNSIGQPVRTMQKNVGLFGTPLAKVIEMFTWNVDGTPRTETHLRSDDNPWHQFGQADWKFTSWDGVGYDKADVKFNFNQAKLKIEENHDADGNMISRISSWDDGPAGGPLPGGFDRVDVLTQFFTDDFMFRSENDLGNDGVIDEIFTSVLLS